MTDAQSSQPIAQLREAVQNRRKELKSRAESADGYEASSLLGAVNELKWVDALLADFEQHGEIPERYLDGPVLENLTVKLDPPSADELDGYTSVSHEWEVDDA